MAENAKLFRTAVGGFNKDDVTQYIERMNFEFNRDISIAKNETAEVRIKLEQAEKELENYKASGIESERFEAKITVLEENLSKSQATVEDLTKKLAEANERIEAQNDALDKLCVENEELKSNAKTVTIPADPEIEEKAKLYDQMSSKIGVMIMDANRNADALISATKEQASGIVSNAENEAKRIIADADRKAEAIHQDAIRRTEAFEGEYRSIFTQYSSAISLSLQSIENDIERCKNELKDKANCLYTKKAEEQGE